EPPAPSSGVPESEGGVVLRNNPPKGRARVTVVRDGAAREITQTLIIVLDWSLSMGYNQDNEIKHDIWKQAVESLRALLRELPSQTVVGVLRSNANIGGPGESSTLEVVRAPKAYDFANNPVDLNNLIGMLPYPEGRRSPVARWVEDAVKKEKMF